MNSASFDELLDEYIDGMFAASPVLASSLGVTDYDHLLDDRSEEGRERDWAFVDSWISRLSAVPAAVLMPDQLLDRDLVLADLTRRRLLRPVDGLRSTPKHYVRPGLSGVSMLFSLRLCSEEQLVEAALERMASIPRLLDNGMRLLQPGRTSLLAVDQGLRLTRAAASYFRTGLAREVESPDLAIRLRRAGRTVAAAHDRFGDFLTGLAVTASGDWALGADLYSALLRDGELVGYNAEDLLLLGEEALEAVSEQLRSATARLGRAGRREWEAARRFATLAERLAYLEQRVEAARLFVLNEGLLTLPDGERCEVRPVPDHQRALTAAASYQRPPAFGRSTAGVFYWPTPPGETFHEADHGRAARVDTIVAHEAYPGHHAHFSRCHENRRRVRQLHSSSFLNEGWGVYAERLMYSHGFFERPLEELTYLRTLRLRAARVILDVGLHTGRIDIEEGVDFMRERLGYPESTSRLEIERYCATPIQAASYFTGLAAVEELRDEFMARGATTLEFHDSLTSVGSVPPTLARRALIN